MCAKVCPTGALEVRKAGKLERDDSYLYGSLKPTVVNETCVHCGMCEEVCPQECIDVQKRKLAQDASLRIDGKTMIDQNSCVHCGWCASICPVEAITMEKPFSGESSRDENVCQACRTCVDTCPCDACAEYLKEIHMACLDIAPCPTTLASDVVLPGVIECYGMRRHVLQA